MRGCRVLIVKVAASDVQTDKVDTEFLNECHPGSAGKANRPTIVLEFHDRGFPNKIFDRNDRDLDIPVLERNIKLSAIVQLVGDSDLAAVGNVTPRSIGVGNAALGSSAGFNMVARKVFGAIRNGYERPAVNHGPNPFGGSLNGFERTRLTLDQRSKLIKVLILDQLQGFGGFLPVRPTEHLFKLPLGSTSHYSATSRFLQNRDAAKTLTSQFFYVAVCVASQFLQNRDVAL